MSHWHAAANGGLDAVVVPRMLTAHAVPGVERLDPDGRYARLVPTSAGPTPVRLRIDDDGVTVEAPDAADRAELDALIRRWFDLDTDLAEVNATLSRDPLLADLIDRHPRLRPLGQPDRYEAAIGSRARSAGLGRRGPDLRRSVGGRVRTTRPGRPA